jgi:hypothetical protein
MHVVWLQNLKLSVIQKLFSNLNKRLGPAVRQVTVMCSFHCVVLRTKNTKKVVHLLPAEDGDHTGQHQHVAFRLDFSLMGCLKLRPVYSIHVEDFSSHPHVSFSPPKNPIFTSQKFGFNLPNFFLRV